jgi:hypothetical protein
VKIYLAVLATIMVAVSIAALVAIVVIASPA